MIAGPDKPYTITARAWCEDADKALAPTYYGHRDMLVNGVASGRMELFNVNGDSWLVTEIMGGMLFVWCYAGRGLVHLIERLRVVAAANGLSQVSFFTRHAAAVRALRRFNPRALPTKIDGETQYVIDVPKHGA